MSSVNDSASTVATTRADYSPSLSCSYSLHKYRDITSRAEEERDAQIEKAKGLLGTIDHKRTLRAQLGSLEDSLTEVRDWTVKAQRHNEDCEHTSRCILSVSLIVN